MRELVRMKAGSHLYGTNIEGSDLDVKGVYLPDARDILFQKVQGTLKHVDGLPKFTDSEVFSFQQYMKLLLQGQTVALDMLFTPREAYLAEPEPEWSAVVNNRESWLSSKVSAMVGFARSQASKYCLKAERLRAAEVILDFLRSLEPSERLRRWQPEILDLIAAHDYIEREWIQVRDEDVFHLSVCGRKVPLSYTVKQATEVYEHLWEHYGSRVKEAKDMNGSDWKALMHALRITEETKELLRDGVITLPRPEAEFLVKIRQGEVDRERVLQLITDGAGDVKNLQEKTLLPEEPDHALAEKLVENFYRVEVCDTHS
jgi:hypothetical protein